MSFSPLRPVLFATLSGFVSLTTLQAEVGVGAKPISGAETVIDGSRDAELRQVARMRLARVLIEQSKPDEALALLDPSTAGAFAPHFHDIRGDALTAKGDTVGARRAYDAALAADPEQKSLDRDYVALKRESLPAAPAAGAAP